MKSASKTKFVVALLAAAVAFCWTSAPDVLAQTTGMSKREAAKARVQAERYKLQNATGVTPKVTPTTQINAAAALMAAPAGIAENMALRHFANSPTLAKFVDALPGLCNGADAPGTCVASDVSAGEDR